MAAPPRCSELQLDEVAADEEPEARQCSYDGEHGAREPARPRPKLENALNGASARNDEAENERDQKERSGRPRSPAIKATGVNLDCDEGRHWNPE